MNENRSKSRIQSLDVETHQCTTSPYRHFSSRKKLYFIKNRDCIVDFQYKVSCKFVKHTIPCKTQFLRTRNFVLHRYFCSSSMCATLIVRRINEACTHLPSFSIPFSTYIAAVRSLLRHLCIAVTTSTAEPIAPIVPVLRGFKTKPTINGNRRYVGSPCALPSLLFIRVHVFITMVTTIAREKIVSRL